MKQQKWKNISAGKPLNGLKHFNAVHVLSHSCLNSPGSAGVCDAKEKSHFFQTNRTMRRLFLDSHVWRLQSDGRPANRNPTTLMSGIEMRTKALKRGAVRWSSVRPTATTNRRLFCSMRGSMAAAGISVIPTHFTSFGTFVLVAALKMF